MAPTWARVAAALWGFAEGTLFFIVPDVLLTAIAIRSLRNALVASLLATAGAMAGGTVMYFWGADPGRQEAAYGFVGSLPDVRPHMPARVREELVEMGAPATVLGPLRTTPYKLYAMHAPASQVSYGSFMLITPVARLPRFMLVSLAAALAARYLRPRLATRGLYWTWLAAWVAIYVVLWRTLIF
jgi:membrane protein YqaA with SNARE-associated domain